MQIYEVRISRAARIDMANLRAFLGAMHVYHIEREFVILDRILPSKMNKG